MRLGACAEITRVPFSSSAIMPASMSCLAFVSLTPANPAIPRDFLGSNPGGDALFFIPTFPLHIFGPFPKLKAVSGENSWQGLLHSSCAGSSEPFFSADRKMLVGKEDVCGFEKAGQNEGV